MQTCSKLRARGPGRSLPPGPPHPIPCTPPELHGPAAVPHGPVPPCVPPGPGSVTSTCPSWSRPFPRVPWASSPSMCPPPSPVPSTGPLLDPIPVLCPSQVLFHPCVSLVHPLLPCYVSLWGPVASTHPSQALSPPCVPPGSCPLHASPTPSPPHVLPIPNPLTVFLPGPVPPKSPHVRPSPPPGHLLVSKISKP